MTAPRDVGARANYLPLTGLFALRQACGAVLAAFPESVGCFLVGSSLDGDYRDVDVRLILPDAAFDALFAGKPERWSFVCLTASVYLAQQSGLPIDFQIQRMTDANRDHGKRRQALVPTTTYSGAEPPAAAILGELEKTE